LDAVQTSGGTHIGVLAVDVAGRLVVKDIVDWILAEERIGEEGVGEGGWIPA
jgi:hypothetical protein